MANISPKSLGAPPFQKFQPDGPYVSTIYARKECLCVNATGRNLVICIDGTLNQANEMPSNVIKLYSLILKDATQLTYYNSGIGTYVRDSTGLRSWYQWASQMKDIIIASNLKARILSAYQWLTENYVDGDRIFLFGFSRGAYQVRVIAGMLHRVGLLHKGNNEQIPFAYENYQRSVAGSSDHLCEWFKANFSRPAVRAHFVGAWDTVSSVGFFQGTHLPETTNGMRHVCGFRHALALDERRVKFLPDFANGSDAPQGENVKEVWFAGFHSDIGGSNPVTDDADEKALGGPALLWMIHEANYFGLHMRAHTPNYHRSIPINSSMNRFWKFVEYLPFLVPGAAYDGESKIGKYGPHFSKPRQILKGQLIHNSVRDKIKDTQGDYIPAPNACFKSGNWTSPGEDDEHWFEKNWYLDAGLVLSQITKSVKNKKLTVKDQREFSRFASNGIGRFSIISQPTAFESLISVCQEKYEVEGIEGETSEEKFFKRLSDVLAAFITSSSLGDTTRVQRLVIKLGNFLDEHIKNDDDVSLRSRYKLLKEAINKSKHHRHLIVHIDPKYKQLKSLVEAMDSSLVTFELNEAHIRIVQVKKSGQLQVTVVDKDITGRGMHLKTHSIPDSPEVLSYVIAKLSHYYEYLKCTSNTPRVSTDNISISFYEVQDSERVYPRVVKVDNAQDLCKDNVIDINISDSIYGMEVTNNNEHGEPLFPVLLYFDNIDFTISTVYPQTFFSENEDTLRPNGGSLTIGYGDEAGSRVPPLSFYTGSRRDEDAGFFRLFLFKGNTDLRSIEQDEPVFSTSRRRFGEHGFSPPIFEEVMPYSWESITLTVIQRRSEAELELRNYNL